MRPMMRHETRASHPPVVTMSVTVTLFCVCACVSFALVPTSALHPPSTARRSSLALILLPRTKECSVRCDETRPHTATAATGGVEVPRHYGTMGRLMIADSTLALRDRFAFHPIRFQPFLSCLPRLPVIYQAPGPSALFFNYLLFSAQLRLSPTSVGRARTADKRPHS